MKSLAIGCVVLVSLSPLGAQRRGAAARQPVATTSGSMLFLSGKVVLGDGTPLTEGAVIQSICRGLTRNETHTDVHGNFSFQFGERPSSSTDAGFSAENSLDNRPVSRVNSRSPEDCEIQASLSGFSSDQISLTGRVNGAENVDLGRIVLHRLANVEGMTVSATTAAAPREARKAYEKGQQKERRGELTEAQKSFEKAVKEYPKFAAAWFELGNVQKQQNDLGGARKSYEASIAADNKYIHPYRELMLLALHEQKWAEVIAKSERVIALTGVSFPEAWFINSMGNFFVQNYSNAEKSARRGLAIDNVHQVPKLEYLLGLVLMKTNQLEEAATHFQNYMHLVKAPNDVAEAQKQLDEVARLSAARGPVAAQAK